MVTFYFEQGLDAPDLALFDNYTYLEKEYALQLSLKSKDLAKTIKHLVDRGTSPVNIKTENILQQTYFNLSR